MFERPPDALLIMRDPEGSSYDVTARCVFVS